MKKTSFLREVHIESVQIVSLFPFNLYTIIDIPKPNQKSKSQTIAKVNLLNNRSILTQIRRGDSICNV